MTENPTEKALRAEILHKRSPCIDQQEVNRPVTVHWFDAIIGDLHEIKDAIAHPPATPNSGAEDGVTLAEGFECEQDEDTFTIRFPSAHAITAFANGRIIVTKAENGFAPFALDVARLTSANTASEREKALSEALRQAGRLLLGIEDAVPVAKAAQRIILDALSHTKEG